MNSISLLFHSQAGQKRMKSNENRRSELQGRIAVEDGVLLSAEAQVCCQAVFFCPSVQFVSPQNHPHTHHPPLNMICGQLTTSWATLFFGFEMSFLKHFFHAKLFFTPSCLLMYPQCFLKGSIFNISLTGVQFYWISYSAHPSKPEA